MPILVIGMNHRTAPVAVRETGAISEAGLRSILTELCSPGGAAATPGADANPAARIDEAVILSTCNRLELYIVAEEQVGRTKLAHLFAHLVPVEPLQPHLYCRQEEAAVEHLMRVAAGLDSLVLGEPQILGQLVRAVESARSAGTVGPHLSRLFSQAIRAGKRARTETAISCHTASISHAAIQLVRDQLPDLRTAQVAVIGAGEMAQLAVKALQMHRVTSIACVNRTHARAEALARQVQGQAIPWSNLREILVWADVAITATSAPDPVVRRQDLAPVLPRRVGRRLVLVDVSLPRNVEEAVDGMPGIVRYDLDSLQAVLDKTLDHRQAAIPRVEQIINEEMGHFLAWLNSRQAVPVIVEMRRKAQLIAQDEVTAALGRLPHLDPKGQQVVAGLARRLVNRLLHEPTVRLKYHAVTGDGDAYARAIAELFAIG